MPLFAYSRKTKLIFWTKTSDNFHPEQRISPLCPCFCLHSTSSRWFYLFTLTSSPRKPTSHFILAMEQNESQLQSVGVCHKLFYFIMRTLAAQALKPVTLGPPVPREPTQRPSCPRTDRCSITHDSTFGGSIKGPEDYESDASIDVEEVSFPLLEDEEGKVVKVEMVGESRPKAPKKVVSIKDEPEVIYLSNKRRKTMADRQSSGLYREKDSEPRPLKSILKVGSSSDVANSNVASGL